MIYLIGLGLNEKGMSSEGLDAVKKCRKVYLENYTVEFPYSIDKLEKIIGKKIEKLNRGDVESDKLISGAKKKNICFLVYGSPLFATTHISLLLDCKKAKVKVEVIYSASVFDALGSTGLQLYKFGKISSMPKWQEHFEPDSFLDFVIENKKINAHSLILVDIGLSFKDALMQMEKVCKRKNYRVGKLVVCSKMGTKNQKIYYGKIRDLKRKKIAAPFCFIIPGKMHFLEEEFLKHP